MSDEHWNAADEAEDTTACTCPSVVLERLAARYGLATADVAEIATELAEAGITDSGSGEAMTGTAQLRQMAALQRRAFYLLISYMEAQKTLADALMATRAMALELGFLDAAGAPNVAELARLLGVGKQTVNKACQQFQARLGLPPRIEQRDEAAREAMRAARIKQLEQTT